MKKIIFPLFCCLLVSTVNAQKTRDIWRNFEVFRITLKEKVNLPIRKLPVELVRAYCEGNIKAYYPMDTSKECSYHEFVAHFNTGATQPAPGSGNEFQSASCPQSFCSANDESLLENFLVYVDLLQVTRFDKNKSTQTTEVKYVRLKYVYMKHNMEIVLDGPVFKYEDIAALSINFPTQYQVPNPKNVAENHSIKKILDTRMFTGIVPEKFKPFEHPTDNKDKNKEKDTWHH